MGHASRKDLYQYSITYTPSFFVHFFTHQTDSISSLRIPPLYSLSSELLYRLTIDHLPKAISPRSVTASGTPITVILEYKKS